MPRGVAKAKDGVEKKGKEVGKKNVVRRSRKMRGGDYIFSAKIKDFVTLNTPTFKLHKDAIIKVLQSSMIGYNSIARSLTPSRLDFNKSSRFKNTLKTTIDYLNAIGNIISKNPNPDDVKFPLYPVANELADVLLDILDKDGNMKGIEQRNDLILQFIYIKIFILFTEFEYFCDRIKDIREYNIVEAPQVEGVAELAAANTEKDAAVAELATEKEAKKKVDAELATANAAKKEVDAELVAEKEAKKKVDAELAKLTAAKKAVEAEFAETKIKYQETEEKFKLLEENILTIDEDYFKNALNNAKNKYIKGEYSEATKILDNIIAIWQILSDDSELKKNITISEIINNEIPILKRTYGLGGGKRKINSSRTKRK